MSTATLDDAIADDALIARCIAGDDRAYSELRERYWNGVYASVMRALSKGAVRRICSSACDVTQEFFEEVFLKRDKLLTRFSRLRGRFERLLTKAAYRYASEKVRSPRFGWPGAEPIAAWVDSDERNVGHEEPCSVDEADEAEHWLAQLDGRRRGVMEAHYGLGAFVGYALTDEQIARRLNCSTRTVRRCVKDSVDYLRSLAASNHESGSGGGVQWGFQRLTPRNP